MATLTRTEELEYGSGWKPKGITDDVTQCEHCGRRGLKRTVAMVPLDADGNEDGDAAYFGTGCAVGYVKRGTIRGRVTGAAVVTAARVAEAETERRREWAGEILAKYGPYRDARPVRKAIMFFQYNPHTLANGNAWAADQLDGLLADADAAMNGVSEDRRAAYVVKGRKTLGLDEKGREQCGAEPCCGQRATAAGCIFAPKQ